MDIEKRDLHFKLEPFWGVLRMIVRVWISVLVWILACGISDAQSPTGLELLGRGINFGNMLEAPHEGDWGLRFEDQYPALVKAAGFDSVRIPVRWSSATSRQPPYRIADAFMARVRHVVKTSLDQDLKVVLNVHHFDELYAKPAGQRARFLALWRQLAEEFRNAGEGLYFELLNEPHDQLNADKWNSLLAECLAEVRKLHANRWIVVGPDQWNGIQALRNLDLPENDRRLIVTVHYYLPFDFTHQGASWVTPRRPTGIKWSANPREKAALERDLQLVAEWARQHDRPIYVGEFGAYEAADIASRVAWTSSVGRTCESLDFGWAYWELAAGFGILDPQTKQWNARLVQALIPGR